MSTSPVVKIKADIMWAFLNKKNEMADRYTVDLCNLSDNAVKALEGLGITVNHKDGKGHFITCKSKNPIRAYDDGGSEIDSDVIVGNGSKCVGSVESYEWAYKGKKGVSPSLRKLVITELNQYEGGNDVSADMLDEAL